MVNKEGRSMLRDIISPDKGEPRFLFLVVKAVLVKPQSQQPLQSGYLIMVIGH